MKKIHFHGLAIGAALMASLGCSVKQRDPNPLAGNPEDTVGVVRTDSLPGDTAILGGDTTGHGVDTATHGDDTTGHGGDTTSPGGDAGVNPILIPAAACFDNLADDNLHTVSEDMGAINVYFNKSADPAFASGADNRANGGVNLERRLLHRLAGAKASIDFATYEINLPRIVDALIEKASQGVRVRVIADAKVPADPEYEIRYETMRGLLEKLIRGKDGVVGTADDVAVYADSPILALEDSAQRAGFALPPRPSDLPAFTGWVGTQTMTGRLIALGEEKAKGGYYSAPDQMHNKFAVIDDEWVFTGSWNFTLTGLYGALPDYLACALNGDQQHSIEMRSPEVAAAYRAEFSEMWGGAGRVPNPAASNYHGRKTDNTTHLFTVGGRQVEVYFSPGDGAVERLTSLVRETADSSLFFEIYAWSSQALLDEVKMKWEGSRDSAQGSRTGFSVRGLFDASFWNQWWSAAEEMTGRAAKSSVNNPSRPFRNKAPVCRQGPDSRKLHSKTMVIDGETASDPTAVIGSTNWSANGEDVNDENMVIVHDGRIANQVRQEFEARWASAGCRE